MRMRDSNAGGQGPRRSNQRDECQNGEGVLKALDSRDAIDLERALATEGDAPAASVRVDGRTPREWSRHAFGPPNGSGRDVGLSRAVIHIGRCGAGSAGAVWSARSA
jgi:hypothetical protein